MEHTIGFPNLGLEFTLSRVACTVLGKDIYWYGIIICAGFILAALYVNSRTKDFGITSDNLTDCLIICVPLGIICARIYFVVFEWGYYAQHPGGAGPMTITMLMKNTLKAAKLQHNL